MLFRSRLAVGDVLGHAAVGLLHEGGGLRAGLAQGVGLGLAGHGPAQQGLVEQDKFDGVDLFLYNPHTDIDISDDGIKALAAKIKAIQAQYGRDSFAVVSTGQLLTEEFYTLGKLVRGQIGTNNYDGNTTLCMASAVSGYKRSFGSDGPPGCYEDFEHTHCLMAFGSNLPEQHPIIYWRLKEALEKRKFPVIVVDPRVTMLAQFADIHLPITPGTDTVPPLRQARSTCRNTMGRSDSSRIICLMRSTAAIGPAPCASMPTASMQASGPRPPVISRNVSATSQAV